MRDFPISDAYLKYLNTKEQQKHLTISQTDLPSSTEFLDRLNSQPH